MFIGVCNAASNCGWGLFLSDGALYRFSRNAAGELVNAPPPEGWPDGDRTQLMRNAAGQPADLQGRAEGAVIEVIVDADEGSLAFRVNGEAPLRVPDFAFPQGAQLRPWARLVGEFGDRVSFERGYL